MRCCDYFLLTIFCSLPVEIEYGLVSSLVAAILVLEPNLQIPMMVKHSRGRGGEESSRQREMDEMRRMIEDLSRVMQDLQRQEHVDACVEILEGNWRVV